MPSRNYNTYHKDCHYEHFVGILTAAIIDLYNHPGKRKQMAAASLERSKLFDKETYVKNFFEALKGI